MKESYLKFYTKYKLIANFIFLKDSFFSKNRLKKLSLINRNIGNVIIFSREFSEQDIATEPHKMIVPLILINR